MARKSFLFVFIATAGFAFGQSQYKIISVVDGGTISGNVKWSGSMPRNLTFPVTKDAKVCDPDSRKSTDLERLIVGQDAHHSSPASGPSRLAAGVIRSRGLRPRATRSGGMNLRKNSPTSYRA